ncbi:hypothetical protein Ssi03_34810 [Sphaerisporangium siamense]|uniref:Uncharacterized protein n=2 Tax=Sphaerisporangium TaxID=321315 RepID=A0A7W8Z6A3_9ACTN|nr:MULTISPECIES: hypothetical protein [Sphaerisporangium]MBB4701367.1 hypothetical protein [Sphaerisporangium siamense]MBB5627883.1 hypothetical protein [Sphaerisporangium krabiense]GII62042.1 hypothetical protein Skr01_21270 [Sphaerisporangium krabiense]GII85491.1 hypothetical protein Ssi03_34810 [Sphaerisporangium siamense]
METVDLEDLGLELLLIAALHAEAERLVPRLPEPSGGAFEWNPTLRPS